MTQATFDPGVQPLLRDAAAWRLTALLLERPRAGWKDEVTRLAREVDDDELREAARLAAEATEGLYLGTLGPTGLISPREVSHAGMRDAGHLLAEIEAYYDAFAYEPQSEDPVDHVAVEAGFVGYLRLKEAFARARGEAQAAEISARAASDFATGHLASCAARLSQALESGVARYLWLTARALSRRAGQPVHAPGPSPVIWLDDTTAGCCPDPPAD